MIDDQKGKESAKKIWENHKVDVFNFKSYLDDESCESDQLEGPAKVIDELIMHDMEHTLAELMDSVQ